MGIWQAIRGVFRRDDDDDDGDEGNAGNDGGALVRTPAEVAKRFVLLVLVAELADSIALEGAGKPNDALAMRKRTLDDMQALGFTVADLEPREMTFVSSLRTGKVDPQEAAAASWRLECAGVLAWSLGFEAAIPDLEWHIEIEPLRSRIPSDAAGCRIFVNGATLRPDAELLAARGAWMEIWFRLEIGPPGEYRSRALERMRALRWITEPPLPGLCSTRVVEA